MSDIPTLEAGYTHNPFQDTKKTEDVRLNSNPNTKSQRRKLSLTRVTHKNGNSRFLSSSTIPNTVPAAAASTSTMETTIPMESKVLSIPRRIVRTLRSLSATRRHRREQQQRQESVSSSPTRSNRQEDITSSTNHTTTKPFILEILPHLLTKPTFRLVMAPNQPHDAVGADDVDDDDPHTLNSTTRNTHSTSTTTRKQDSSTSTTTNATTNIPSVQNKPYFLQGTWANPILYTVLDGKRKRQEEEVGVQYHDKQHIDYKSTSSLQLLKLLLQTDILYHQTIQELQPDVASISTSTTSIWEETYQGYIKIMYILMTFIQNQWKNEYEYIVRKEKISHYYHHRQTHSYIHHGRIHEPVHHHEEEEEYDDLIGSKRDLFFRQLHTLRIYTMTPIKDHTTYDKNKKEIEEDETPIVTNKKYLTLSSSEQQDLSASSSSTTTSSTSILNSMEIQIVLSALADIFIRLANVSIRDSHEMEAVQYLQDARCIQNIPSLNVPLIRTHLGLRDSHVGTIKERVDIKHTTTTPSRRQVVTNVDPTETLSPISDMSKSSPTMIPLISSSSTIEDEKDISSTIFFSPSSSTSLDESSMFIINHSSSPLTSSTSSDFSLLSTTMTQDQQRVHTQTMHNFIHLLSLQTDAMMKTTKKTRHRQYIPQFMIHQYDCLLQMYSDCLRWKRRTLRELEKEKKNTTPSSCETSTNTFAYKNAEMSYTRTLVNIGTIKAQSIMLKPHIQPPGGSVVAAASILSPSGIIPSTSPREQERWIKAERFLKQALSLRVQYHGLEDRDVGSTLVSLGDFYFLQGQLDMAIRSYQEVIRIRMALKEENRLFTAMTWYNLAVAQYRMGHYGHARESAARALMIRMKHVDKVESIGQNMASILYILGMAQSSLGEYDDARNNLNRALVIRKKLLPHDHLLILNVVMAMGIDSLNERKWDEATTRFMQVHRTRSSRLGLEHPLTLEALYFLALVIRDKGQDIPVAVDMLHLVLDGRNKNVGGDDAKTVDVMCALAESYRKCRMSDHAVMVITQALKVCDHTFGKHHVIYANALSILGEIQLEQGNVDGSLDSLQQVMEIHMIPENAATVTIIQTADVWQRMGQAYFQKGEYQFATQAFLESLKLKAECISHSDPSFWKSLSVLGQAQYKCGDLKSALDAFTESLKCQSLYYLGSLPDDTAFSKSIVLMALETIRETLQSMGEKSRIQIEEDLEQFALTLNVLGIINQEMGNITDAIESFDLCFLARNIKPSRDYEALGHTADTLGLLYFGTGEHQKALSAFRDALSIKESGLGEKSLEVARTLNNMGNVYFAKGKLDEAIEHYNQSYEIKKQVLGSNHEEVANTLNNIAHVLFKIDRREDSFKTYVEVFQMRRTLYGDDSLAIAVTYCNIGDVQVQLGHLEAAKDCFERCLQIRAIHKYSNYEDNVRIMESLARIEGKLGLWNNAATLYRGIIDIRKNRLGQEKTEILSKTYQLLAHAFIEQQQYDDALPHLYEALRIRTLYILSSSSEEISELMHVINFCKAKQQKI